MHRAAEMFFAVALGFALGGCVSDPAFEQPLGDSVRQMISAQTWEPDKPDGEPRPMLYDGTQTQRGIETYRAGPAVRPQTQTIQVGR